MAAPDFSRFEPYLKVWGLPTVEQRLAKRAGSTVEEMQEFHDALVPDLESIIDFLNSFPVDGIPAEHLPLKYAVLSLLHVDRPVNRWRKAMLDEARDPRKFQMKSSMYDAVEPK